MSESKPQGIRFIFVGGCSRSGTTLLQKLLIAHTQVAGGAEFDHGERVMTLYRTMLHNQKDRHKDYYTTEELAAIFRNFYHRAFARILARKPTARFISEKTPRNIFAAEDLLRVFPDALYVNIVRDGRDVVLSHLEVNRRLDRLEKLKFKQFKFGPTCRLWNQCVETYHRISQDPSIGSRVLNVSYEALVTTPQQSIPELLKKLGLEMESQLLKQEESSFEEAGIKADRVWTPQEMLDQPINTGRIGRWRKGMGPLARWVCEVRLARNLARTGYEVHKSSHLQQQLLLAVSGACKAFGRFLRKFRPSNLAYHIRKRLG